MLLVMVVMEVIMVVRPKVVAVVKEVGQEIPLLTQVAVEKIVAVDKVVVMVLLSEEHLELV
tara:strand:- start:14 stop:196 length:183 start_codon:yes stop_codon:yes gene_type:complete